MKRLFLSLILILFVSGCANLPFDIPFFQSTSPKVKELPQDVISIKNITVIPSTSIRERGQFSVFFELTNHDEFNDVSVSYNLYDTGLCTPLGGDPSVNSTSRSGVFDPPLFSPQETRLVEWNFQAPSAEEIAYLRVTCPIRFKFDFPYHATSQIDVVVIDELRLRELQRAGTAKTFKPTVSVGRGPIKIYFDFGASLPVKENSLLPVYIVVHDKGTGILREIETDTLEITFPFDVPSGACTPTYFTCSGRVCRNSVAPIPIISKKSLEIRCDNIYTPSVDLGIEKTFFISAVLEYNYSAVGEVKVEVNP